MKARVLHRSDVLKIVDLLVDQGYEVIAPFRGRGRDTYFDIVDDENRERIQIHLPNPYYPPKRFVIPHIERMLKVDSNNGGIHIEEIDHPPKRAIFGIRSCDTAGIFHLDRFYLGRDFKDIYYQKRRENLLLINMVCTYPGEDINPECFCMCADTGPAAKAHFDLQLMDLGDEFMVVAGSSTGEAILSNSLFMKGDETHIKRRLDILNHVRRHFRNTNTWFSGATRYVTRGEVSEKTWETIGNRCLECGGCTYVCPACTCFTVSDRQVEPGVIERVRVWDSCALAGFTRMAGGHNPRAAVHDRRNRRFFRKLAHHFIQSELSMACVGCGRCAAVCHGDVGMPNSVEIIRRETTEIEEHAAI
jgi:sulfhydrogenase subunit beta (sulfur reductase)